ncbi:MAG: HAD family hydrolase [Chloroflexi bacterium]|nr:HAD family hydrolase [Chloroflexota bacterium]
MACDAIISDWNGTIVGYRDEKPILQNIARGVFKSSLPFHPLRMVSILRAQRELETLYTEGRRKGDFDYIREMFRVFNGRIVAGVPVPLVLALVDRYAAQPGTQNELDLRVLRPISEAHREGKVTGVYSAGYRYGIEMILTVAGFRQDFDFCEADDLREEKGRAVGFMLNIYRNKPRLLAELLSRRGLDARRVAYLGDSEDDEGCFEMVQYPVVPFLAPEEAKQRYARKYRAFVPESEKELSDFLRRR